MITQCAQCGGLRADPGEMYGGRPCECLLPPARGSAAPIWTFDHAHLAKESRPVSEEWLSNPKYVCCTIPWMDRLEEQRKYGLMVGALLGLRYRVDSETRKVIESILDRVGEPYLVAETKPPNAPGEQPAREKEKA